MNRIDRCWDWFVDSWLPFPLLIVTVVFCIIALAHQTAPHSKWTRIIELNERVTALEELHEETP